MGRAKWKIALLVLVLLSLLTITISNGNASMENVKNKTVVDPSGVIYKLDFEKGKDTLIIKATNMGENTKKSGYNVLVDKRRVYSTDISLDQNEVHNREISIIQGINVNENSHSVKFVTYGNATQFNFTREINSSDPDGIPRPHITNVEVTNGQVKGKSSAVAEVTLVNPSDQIYSTKLFVHTTETDGSLYPASVRPGDTRTITVELLDERGSKIAGEVRLYTGNLTTKDGAMDQVEFAGQAGSDTRTWNASYEPVRPTWMSNNYEYHNGSYARSFGEKVSGGHEVGGVPLAYVGLALVGGFGILRKLR